LDRPAPMQAQVNYITSNMDAIAGLDYVATSGILTIPAGATSATFQVSIIGDLKEEKNERFVINFSNPVNVILRDDQSSIMIIDNDKGNKNNDKKGLKIPTVIRRNYAWIIPLIDQYQNEITIWDIQGKVVFNMRNYRNVTTIGNVNPGIYFYQIKISEKNGKIIYYTGMVFITD